jgi:hypothetical protein
VEGAQLALLLGLVLLLGLLLLGLPVPSSPHPAAHRPDDGAHRRTLAGVPGDGADERAPGRAPRGAPYPFASTHCRPGLSRRRGRLSDGRRINPGRLFRPRPALTVVILLLLGTLTLGGIDDRLLRRRRPRARDDEACQDRDPDSVRSHRHGH